jgi:hypothetical protein
MLLKIATINLRKARRIKKLATTRLTLSKTDGKKTINKKIKKTV